MAKERKALMTVFRPKSLEATDKLRRKWSSGSYQIFLDMPGLLSKCWWCNQEKGEWGAFYIFDSEEALQAYIASNLWKRNIPEKYGCIPEATIVDPGPILCKEIITQAENSWLSE